MKGYVDGGATSNAIFTNTIDSSTFDTSSLISVISRLNDILSNGLLAKIIFGYKDVEEIEKMMTEIKNSKNNGNIA